MPYLRLHTPFDVERVRPTVLIAGNSRSAVLPPQAFQSVGEIAYNASMPGARLLDVRHLVEHAHTINPLKLVVIGLDQIMFRKATLNEETLAGLNRYRKIDPSVSDRFQFIYQRFEDYCRSLFSMNAITDAWRVLSGDYRNNIEFRDDGTWDLESIATAGSRKNVYRRLAKKIYRTQIAEQANGLEFDELKELLDFTDANGIRTILFISPMQGLILNTIELTGAWEQYINWQRELVTLVAARNTDTEIYGVENNPQFVLEPIEAPQRLFRDGVHYTRRAAMKIAPCLDGPCEEGFRPTRLNSQTINAYLARVDALRRQYAHDNPAEVLEAQQWILDEEKSPQTTLW